MISSPLPLPTPALPAPAPATAAPAASGETTEQNPGGFARLLDQAREAPAEPAAAAQAGDAAGDKARARSTRAGPARPAAAQPELPTAAPASPSDRGDEAGMTVGVDEPHADAAAAPAAHNADTAALLASLAAFARPAAAAEVPAGKTARSTGDLGGQAPARPAGRMQAPLAQAGVAPAVPKAAAGDGPAADRGAASSVLTAEPPTAENAAAAGSRGFAAELQATLAGPGLTPQATGAATAASAHTAAPATPSQLVASPGSPGFAPELGATLATFVRDGVHHARLELNPAEMGPLTVQIQLDGQTAQVHLAAQQADTRQALEQAMPTLAGSLREAGLTLSGGGVFEQPRQPQQHDAPGGGRDSAAGGTGDEQPGPAEPMAAPLRRRGVVDLVA